MSQFNNISKVEDSQRRLKTAFVNLETIVIEKINSSKQKTKLHDEAEKNVLSLKRDNNNLTEKYNQLELKYTGTKEICQNIVKDLDTSITFLEKLLDEENADN